MFGYVLPLRGELKVREAEAYQGVYCGLCHALGRSYGLVARMLLSYDFAFLAMVLSAGEEPLAFQHRRCIACPLRGKNVCTPRKSLDLAADESIILVYWKLRDSVADESFWKGLGARLLSAVLRRAYRKASARCPEFAEQTVACLKELRQLEKEKCSSLDRTADTFARILRAAAPDTGVEARDRAVRELLYHVGRWIYLVDAWDDLEEDRSAGCYNPVELRWKGEPEKHREEMRTTLRHSLNLAVSACNLVEFGPWNEVILNILYLGLPAVEEAVFTGRWRKIKKETGRARVYERSI